jgi:hypothetical protein
MTLLYAWVNPVGEGDMDFVPHQEGFSALVDHTWVTTYDNRQDVYTDIAAVRAKLQQYWFCWGVFHAQGSSTKVPGGFAGQAPADLGRASCLCLPNQPSKGNPPAQGTIFRYGINGVCHQLANQVLWATGSATTPPLTVRIARGYWLSTALYGSYGRNWASNAWAEKKNACAVGAALSPEDEPDVFAARVHAVFGQGLVADAHDKVLTHRDTALAALAAMAARPPAQPDAATRDECKQVNQIALEFQQRAAEKLTPEQYRQIFELEPDERLALVDPGLAG